MVEVTNIASMMRFEMDMQYADMQAMQVECSHFSISFRQTSVDIRGTV